MRPLQRVLPRVDADVCVASEQASVTDVTLDVCLIRLCIRLLTSDATCGQACGHMTVFIRLARRTVRHLWTYERPDVWLDVYN